MTKPMHVFVTRAIPEAGLRILRAAGLTVDVWAGELPPDREALLARVAGCDGLLSLLTDRIDDVVMDAAGPGLKVISNFAVGVNNVDVTEAAGRGIGVGHTPDVLTEATADLAFALLIGAARRIGEAQRYVREGQWQTWNPRGHVGQDLTGKTLGIFGLGRIGAALARRCVGGWNMKVVYCNRQPRPERAQPLGAEPVELETLLEVSDFVSVHAPLTPDTAGIFDASAFARMKSTAVFVNTARGGLHDEDALYEALSTQQIFAAGLDVTNPEPMRSDARLLTLPNCIVLPHIASATTASRDAMATIAADNIVRGLAGQPLRCPVIVP